MSSMTFYSAMSERANISTAIAALKAAQLSGNSDEVNTKICEALDVLADAVKKQAELWGEMQREMRNLSNLGRSGL